MLAKDALENEKSKLISDKQKLIVEREVMKEDLESTQISLNEVPQRFIEFAYSLQSCAY